MRVTTIADMICLVLEEVSIRRCVNGGRSSYRRKGSPVQITRASPVWVQAHRLAILRPW